MNKQYSRTQNVKRNVFYGLLQVISSIIFPFIVRTILIYRFGAAYLGLNSLFTSILTVLSIAEMGFGSAVVFSLYRPAAENDTISICAYLNYYRKIYHLIGIIILCIGLLLLPFLPFLVHDSRLPGNLNLYICYLFFLGDTVLGYLLFGYMTAIPLAFQRRDLISKIDILCTIIKCFIQSLLLFSFKHFYLFLMTMPLITAFRNVILAYTVKKHYPLLKACGLLPVNQKNELRHKVYGLFINRLFLTSRNGIDNICISTFIGLTMTGIYNNYFFIMHGISVISSMICLSMMPSVGNSIATESREKNYADMRRFDFIYMAISGWSTTCLFCLYQPFIALWAGSKMMLGIREVTGFCIYFYIMRMGDMRWVYHEGAGLWWECRYIAVAETLANIILNIMLCKIWGIAGIISATILSLFFINFLCCPIVLFHTYFKNNKLKEFFFDHFQYAITMIITAVSSWQVCRFIPSSQEVTWFGIICMLLRILICTILSAIIFWGIWHHTNRYKNSRSWVCNLHSAEKEKELSHM